VIHNGIDTDSFSFSQDNGEGLLYLGRIENEKGPDIAISVARELDCPLVLAGPIVQQDYFDEKISPMLSETIQYIGVVNHREKNLLLASASCVLMPSRWDEPFGMVAVEAMACGTPVVVSQQGALPEIVKPGITGYIATEEEMAEKVKQAFELDRIAIHRAATEHYDISVVGQKYFDLYQSMLAF
jgi:glycosyltransferase involved in cell wall biosynthesis